MNRNLTTHKSSNSNACKGVLAYRFSFNGQEKTDIDQSVYDFGARLYNGQIGRWFSVDPLTIEYPYFSPYVCNENNPLYLKDNDGRDATATVVGNTITVSAVIYISGYNATSKKATEIQSSIMTMWNAGGQTYTDKNGKVYNVKFDVVVKVDPGNKSFPSQLATGENVVQLSKKDIRSNVIDGVQGNWANKKTDEDVNPDLTKRMYAHEFGHMLGLVDLYYDNESGVSVDYKGVDKNNLMGTGMGEKTAKVNQKSIDAIAEYVLKEVKPLKVIVTPKWVMDSPSQIKPHLENSNKNLPVKIDAGEINLGKNEQVK